MKKTIKNQLINSYLAIAAITIILIITALYGFTYIKKTNHTIDSATKLSRIMGTNLAASLAFEDKNSAEKILESLQVDNTIEAAFVYDQNQELFITHTKSMKQEEAIDKLDLLGDNSVYNDVDNIIVSSEISLDNEVIGKLILLYNTDEVINTLNQMLLIISIISILIMLVVLKIASVLQRRLTVPIYTLVNTMGNFLVHDSYTNTIDDKRDDEFQTVFDGYNTMLKKIQKNKSELEALANTDSLTELNTRRHFFKLVNQFLNMTNRKKIVSTILMFDLDKFKNINDTYGHNVGDQILHNFSKVLIDEQRKGDVFARFGGEEFIAFLPNTSAANALLVAKRIQSSTETYRDVQNVKFTVSIGLCEFHDDVNRAIINADLALYKAKENGRNQVVLYTVNK